MKEIIKLVGILVLVTLIATAMLSFTYAITRPLIEKERENKFQEKIKSVFPESDLTKKVDGYFEVYKGN